MIETNTACPFCNISTIQTQGLGSYGTIQLLYPNRPIVPQHILITTRHIPSPDMLTPDEARDIIGAYGIVKKAFRELYGYTGANMFVNDGREAGQHIPHVHFHIFGRSANDPEDPYKILSSSHDYPVGSLEPSGYKIG